MHVLILPSWYPMHYAQTRGIFFKEQAQALKSQGIRTGIIFPNFRGLRTFGASWDVLRDHFQTTFQMEAGIPVYRFHGWNPKIERLRLWAFRRQSRRLFQTYVDRHGKPDLIHAHSTMWGAVAAQDLFRAFDLPYVITEHSSAFLQNRVDEWQKPYIRKSFEGADAIWAVSDSFKRSLQPFAGEANIDVMPNMVDVSFFHLPLCPRVSSPFKFLSIGSLTPNKGIDLLLRAFARVVRINANIEMEIGGAGPEEDHLRHLAHHLGVQDHIRFLGRLSREEVRRAMWRANAFVSSSYVETFGVVLIEAMATGLPVVATQSGGPSDIVSDEVGHIVPTGDVEALSRGMNQIRRDCIDENGIRNYIRNKYSAEVVTRRLRLHYRTITGAIRS